MYSVSVCFHRQTLGIWAVLDTEPEANETFPVLLSSPSGGARLREAAAVLENLAPSSLVRIRRTLNRSLLNITPHTAATNLCRSTYCNVHFQYSSIGKGMSCECLLHSLLYTACVPTKYPQHSECHWQRREDLRHLVPTRLIFAIDNKWRNQVKCLPNTMQICDNRQ